jgi:hypothetical protein
MYLASHAVRRSLAQWHGLNNLAQHRLLQVAPAYRSTKMQPIHMSRCCGPQQHPSHSGTGSLLRKCTCPRSKVKPAIRPRMPPRRQRGRVIQCSHFWKPTALAIARRPFREPLRFSRVPIISCSIKQNPDAALELTILRPGRPVRLVLPLGESHEDTQHHNLGFCLGPECLKYQLLLESIL